MQISVWKWIFDARLYAHTNTATTYAKIFIATYTHTQVTGENLITVYVCVCACDLVCTLSFHFSAHITERFKCEICLIAKLCVRACNVQVIVEPSYALFKRFRKNSYHTTLMHELSCSIANFLYEIFCKYLSMWHDNELIQ